MKQQRNLINTLVLAAIISGLSSTASADAGGRSSDARTQSQAVNSHRLPDEAREGSQQRRAESPASLRLSLEQMDQVHAGAIANDSPDPVPQYGSEGTGVTCRHIACYGK